VNQAAFYAILSKIDALLFQTPDWLILFLFFAIVLAISIYAAKSAGKNTEEFFLGGRNMPWWLLGVSMVATTFSADTPNLVTGFVREGGVSKNWLWWSFLITGMVTVFIYARLWRRSNVLTDLAFYEIRYTGKKARFLRGFRAIYLGLFFNCLIMGSVNLAAIKIGGIMFGLSPETIVISASIIVAFYAALGGIKGVVLTDFFQFLIALLGAVYAAYVAVSQPEIGSLQNLFSHPNVAEKLSFFPDFSDNSLIISMFIIPIAVQWWAVWYPGAEPGGGGYIAQRMLAAKNEKNAVAATLFFNIAHYAFRPWPWIIVALASIVLFPSLADIKEVFPHINQKYLGDDLAYPVMLTLLNPGWLGLVTASLLAAYMSTISTHLNWGASYLVSDFYKQFINTSASEKKQVFASRVVTVLLMLFSGLLSLKFLENASQAFNVLLIAGAGTGPIFLLRWFWWRINALTEIVAMFAGMLVAIILVFFIPDNLLNNDLLDPFTVKLLLAVGLNTIVWLSTALLTKPENMSILKSFYISVEPNDAGWKPVIESLTPTELVQLSPLAKKGKMTDKLLNIFLGIFGVYSALLGIGSFLYGNLMTAQILLAFSAVSLTFIIKRI
jgi:SSS family solute:Na+ symporter